MNGVLETAVEVDRRLRDSGLRYCLIGGIALQRWGEPRMTLDVDVTVMANFGEEEMVIQKILPWFPARIADAAEFARQSRVLLLRTDQRVGIDVSIGGLPFESRMIARSSLWPLDDERSLRTCSAEDLIVLKAFAGRDQDWVDVRNVIARQTLTTLDRRLILEELQTLVELTEDLAPLEHLRQLLP